jgi:type IX secretion system PorP/SprF family membrane protein
MKTFKYSAAIVLSCTMMIQSYGQDPNFSQFFSSPLNINPALTGNIKGKWRVISNYRSQWIGPASPYNTGTISFDDKIFQNVAGNYVDENTRVAVGGMMMYDQAMGGVLKSSYASFNVSGNIRLKEGRRLEMNGSHIRHNSHIKMDEGAEHRLGVGLGAIYGHKRVDFSKLSFGEQFTGFGFDTNLPTGESALSNMKPYVSASAGILYSYVNENTNFDLGVSAFHFNKPKQTVLNDDKQFLASRYVIHGNFETFLTDQVILNTNGVYQYQSAASYFSVGGALGYYLPSDDKDVIVNAGLWYWSKNALVPYLGFTYGNFQVGLTYDITISGLNDVSQKPKTFELCLILRGDGKPDGIIPSPWK